MRHSTNLRRGETGEQRAPGLAAPVFQPSIIIEDTELSGLPSREAALALMHEYTGSESLRKHMLSVEAAMRAYARRLGEDEELWGITGLLHDFDYERYPNAAQEPESEHPSEGVRILRAAGYPGEMLDAIMGHAMYTGVPRLTPLAQALFAVDELCGLITATALVRPSKSVREVDARSVRKKMKDKAFARGVSREDVLLGAAELGVELDTHIQFVIEALQGEAESLGLAGVPQSAAPVSPQQGL